MRGRRGRRAVGGLLGLTVALIVAACAGGASPSAPSASAAAGASPSTSASAPSGPSASIPASPVVGVVTKVDSAGLDKVSGFTLRTSAGQTLVFSIGVLENGAQFPPGHLAEHLATVQPVKVWYRDQDGKLVVYRIEDGA